MNWRGGFARVARATAVLYGIAAIIAVALAAYNTPEVPTGTEYTVEAPSGYSFTTLARSPKEAAAIVRKGLAEGRFVLQATGRAGRVDSPYDSKFRSDPIGAAKNAAVTAAWWLAIYVVFLLAFRGLRWVIAGFLTT